MVQYECMEMGAEMVHACSIEGSLPRIGQCDGSADKGAGFSDAESVLYVLYQ